MKIGPTLSTAIAATLERCINSALRYDPATRQKLAAMDGRSVEIIVHRPSVRFFFRFMHTEIRVHTHAETEANVVISGEVSDFLTAMLNAESSSVDSGLKIAGKIHLLNQLRDIFRQLDIDWEEPLNEIIGIIPGHALAESLRGTLHWLKRQTRDIAETLPEYLTEEIRAIPSKTELEHFLNEVDHLKAAASRLEAKVNRLKEKPTTTKNL